MVDDDVDARKTLVRVLEKEGYTVAGAATANEALDSFDNTVFDLVLTDMRMEGMDGINCCEPSRHAAQTCLSSS